MASKTPSILSRLRSEASEFGSDAQSMLDARLDLARLDLAGHLFEIKRLTGGLALWITFAMAASVALVSLLVVVSHSRAAALYGETHAALLVGGISTALAALGILGAWLRWRSFQRDFRFMEDTLAELHEDLVWLGEWRGDSQAPSGTATDGLADAED